MPALAIVPKGDSDRMILSMLPRLTKQWTNIFVIDAGPAPGHVAGQIASPARLPDALRRC